MSEGIFSTEKIPLTLTKAKSLLSSSDLSKIRLSDWNHILKADTVTN